jgi:hypothetical protein
VADLLSFENYIINEILSKFSIGYPEAVQALNFVKARLPATKKISTQGEADDLIEREIREFLNPKGLLRFKKYSEDDLKELGIKLKFIKLKKDEWDTKIYYDEANDLYWEDAPGRYSNEGFQLLSEPGSPAGPQGV